MTIVEMCVHMDCEGCESKIRRALQKLKGVDDVDINMSMQKVTVTGYVEQKKVLKTVRKTGRRAVLWPYTHNTTEYNAYNQYYPQHHPALNVTAQSYNSHSSAPSSSYNYYKHGYDDSNMHVYHQSSAYNSSVIGERAGNMFSDDNTSGCSIM
ncbi:heavy metal-associated isoprenylated plant protein 28-like [Dioscorea cayenensis subsp. rotundata]|uniref:Heavy metal-associated isoprenylated plant protein 28-like n=1 Tax=Dioscorea cayennensis subsp. rotundata TaxID=55577 RepID=A0AB40CXJ3_DIOCR|nr:heavy metal-associated isoprenylated plant protein 28-like [Dioscorea cayenensis subsp. rotundata]